MRRSVAAEAALGRRWLVVGALFLITFEGRFASIVAFGIGFAAADTMTVKVMPDVFGMRALGAIMGVLALGWRLGAALGPTVAGSLYDVTGSYTLVFGAAPAGVILSWVLFARATSRRRSPSY
jgi:nitrate/nitrite transporter NarK